MNRNHLLIGLGVVLVATLAICQLSKRTLPGDEAIAELIDEAVRLAGEGDASGLMDLVHDDFSGHIAGAGTLDHQEMGLYLAMVMRRSGGFDVNVVSREVSIDSTDGDSATVELTAVILPNRMGNLLEGDASATVIELELVRDGDDWKVLTADHRPAGLSDAL
jgi:hypothetical protein